MSLNMKVFWEQRAITDSASTDGEKLSYREVTDFVPYSKAKSTGLSFSNVENAMQTSSHVPQS